MGEFRENAVPGAANCGTVPLRRYVLVWVFWGFVVMVGVFLTGYAKAEDAIDETTPVVNIDLGASREASRTDDEVVKREEEAIKIDGLNVAQIKEMRDKAEKFTFQAEVNRMMKLIINSLYRNKEVRNHLSFTVRYSNRSFF